MNLKTIKKTIWVMSTAVAVAALIFLGGCAKESVPPTENLVTQEPDVTVQTPDTLEQQPEQPDTETPPEVKDPETGKDTSVLDTKKSQPVGEKPQPPKQVINVETGKDKYQTEPVPEGKPVPVEPEDADVTDTAYTCTLSVRCDEILNNLDSLDVEKTELVPEDGVIFAEKTVTFYEGESVFNVLLREMKVAKIHMEYVNTPIYNSAYIEGISNLYEFDCGELSGWMYKVNDWFPNYGSSRYQLKQDDKIEWIFTCDLGRDIGGKFQGKDQ